MNPLLRLTGLLLAVFLWVSPAFTQAIKGIVRDSTGKLVPYASINLKSSPGNLIIAFTTTDTHGAYLLRLPAKPIAGTLYLEVRCVGYKVQSRQISGAGEEIDFTMVESVSELPSVIVRNHRPVLRTSGDTLSYTVSDFSRPQDRVIGDVIKRLPGISVASDGTISYNNKPVSGVYIGGDNLLDDKYNIATGTIPPGVVDQVQVIDNHQPIKVLRDKVTSDDVALNLTIKDKAKLHLIGKEDVGAGLPGNYDVNLSALAFKNNYKAINELKGNNTGYDLQQDLVSHNLTDYLLRIGNEPPATLLSLGPVNSPALSRDRYLFDQAGLLNANNLVNLNSGLHLRINAYYLHDTQKQDYSQQTTIFLPGDTVRYAEALHNRFEPDLFHAQLVLNANKDKSYVNDAFVLDDNRSINYSALNTNGSMLNQQFTDHSLNFANELNLIKATRSNDIIQGYSYISHFAEPENRSIGPNYDSALFNNDAPYAQLIQKVNVPTWFTNNYISLLIPGEIVNQSFRTGFSIQSQTLNSNLGILQSSNMISPESDSAINHLDWNKKRLYAEADYDIPGEKLKARLSLPVSLQRIDYSDNNYGLARGLTRVYFNPQLRVKYQIGKENFGTLQYSYRNENGSVEDIYQGYILKDYRTLYANNANLTLRQHQVAAIGFNYRKAITLFFFGVNVLYDHNHSNTIFSSVINNNMQQLVTLPFPNNTDSWTLAGSISKYSFALQTTFEADAKWQDMRSVQIQNSSVLPFTMVTGTVALQAETKLSDKVNFSYRITGTQIATSLSMAGSLSRIDQLQQVAAVYFVPVTNWQFKLSGEHYFSHSPGSADLKYFFADASVKWSLKKWKADWELDCVNFLNVRAYNAFNLSQNMLSTSSYTLPGRIILLKVIFDL